MRNLKNMTWGEFEEIMKAQGVRDNDLVIFYNNSPTDEEETGPDGDLDRLIECETFYKPGHQQVELFLMNCDKGARYERLTRGSDL